MGVGDRRVLLFLGWGRRAWLGGVKGGGGGGVT